MKYKVNIHVERRFDANLGKIDEAGNALAPLIQTEFAFSKSTFIEFAQAATAAELRSSVLEKFQAPALIEARLYVKGTELADTDSITAKEVRVEGVIGLPADQQVSAPAPLLGQKSFDAFLQAKAAKKNSGESAKAKLAFTKEERIAAFNKFKKPAQEAQSNKITGK